MTPYDILQFHQPEQLFKAMHLVSEKHKELFATIIKNLFFVFLSQYNKVKIDQRVSYPFLTEKNLHELK